MRPDRDARVFRAAPPPPSAGPRLPHAPSPIALGGLPGALLVSLAVVVAALGAFGPDAPLTVLAAASLVLGVALLWRPGEPPILLFIFLLQWAQASVALFQASAAGIPIDDYFEASGAHGEATALTHCALACLAVGMRLALPRPDATRTQMARDTLSSKPLSRWFSLYLLFWAIATLANYAASVLPALSQVLLGIDALRWAFFFLLAAAHFSQPGRSGLLFYLAFCFELTQGLGGYFSDFKTVFVITALALMTAGARLSVRSVALLALVGAGVGALGIVWTAIKPEYRSFVSGGESAQVVTVPYGERMEKLYELAVAIDEAQIEDATEDLLARLSYVEFFGATLLHVPAATPHENGSLLLDAIARPFTPRFFFPDKPVIDDSERTRKYAGRFVSGVETGTSISLGWVAEMYIDFGRWFMMAAALGIGFFYGGILRALTTWRWSKGALGGAIACAVLVSAAFLESSITKVTGGLVAALIAAWFVIRYAVPSLAPWLLVRTAAR